jgi:hypothetical protein
MRQVTRLIMLWLLLAAVLEAAACAPGERGVQQSPAARDAASRDTGAARSVLLPDDGSVAGWTKKGETRLYGTHNLWDLIDGGAEVYLACGFEEVAAAEYANAAQPSPIGIDVYRMTTPRSAIGIYSQERDPGYQFLHVGAEGYLAGSGLNFWSGTYYVKVTTFQETAGLRQEMEKLAGAVAKKLGNPGSEPEETSYFPPRNLVARSVRYLPARVLNQPDFTSGFEARYGSGKAGYRLVLVSLPDAAAATRALAGYRARLGRPPAMVKDLPTIGDETFAGRDDQYGIVLAARSGRHLAFAVGGQSPSDEVAEGIRTLLSNAARH